MEEHNQRIKVWMGWCLIISALTIDLLETLFTWLAIGAVLSPVMSIGATFLFWLWFQLLGVSYTANTRRFAITAIQAIGEVIPLLDAIPIASFLWTFGMILVVLMTRMEDKGQKPSILGAVNQVVNFGNAFATGGASALVTKAKETMASPKTRPQVKNIADYRQAPPEQNMRKAA